MPRSHNLARFLAMCAIGVAQASDPDAEGQETVWVQDPEVLACSPQVLERSSTLILTLGPRHGKELAIERMSDGTSFFLVVESPPPDMKLLMSPQAFSTATTVETTTSVVGHAWVWGRGSEPIFTTSGRYAVYTSDALESEVGGFTCEVQYVEAPHAL